MYPSNFSTPQKKSVTWDSPYVPTPDYPLPRELVQGRNVLYYPGAPQIGPVPLPASPASSASSFDPILVAFAHPLLRPDNIKALVSSSEFRREMISVPQTLANYKLDESAFAPVQTCIKIRFTTHKSEHLVIDAPNPSIWQVLCAIHKYLHTPISRHQVQDMGDARRRHAMDSYNARRNFGGGKQGMQVLDLVGFGPRNYYFTGLASSEGSNTWTAMFAYDP